MGGSIPCQYKDIFGKPNEGIHSWKILGFAMVDTLLTLLAAYFIAKYFDLKGVVGILFVFVALLIFSVLIHKLFCVETHLTKLLC